MSSVVRIGPPGASDGLTRDCPAGKFSQSGVHPSVRLPHGHDIIHVLTEYVPAVRAVFHDERRRQDRLYHVPPRLLSGPL